MSLAKIRKIVPPPKKPRYAGSDKQWAKFESNMPLKLPSDYRKYISTYGIGSLFDLFYVWSPFNPDKRFNFLQNWSDIDSFLMEVAELEGWLEPAQKKGCPDSSSSATTATAINCTG